MGIAASIATGKAVVVGRASAVIAATGLGYFLLRRFFVAFAGRFGALKSGIAHFI